MLRSKSTAMLSLLGLALGALLATAPLASADATDVQSVGAHAKIIPLKDGKSLVRDAPGSKGDRFSYTTTTTAWSVLAVDPEDYLDTTLQLWDDKAQSNLLGTSDYSHGTLEFIAVDSGHRALDWYHPRVSSPTKFYDYRIQQVQSSGFVVDGQQTVPMPKYGQVTVRDTLLLAGKTYRFILIPAPGEYMAGSMFLMGSDPSAPNSWIQPREQSLKQGVGAINQPVIFDFTAPRTDRYGLVIASQGGTGTFVLQRLPLS